MKITFKDIQSFSVLYEQIQNEKFSFQTSYKLSKLKDSLAKELVFFTTSLKEIISKYAVLDIDGQYVKSEDGTTIKLKEGKIEACQKEVDELQKVEVIIDDVYFDLDEFKDVNLTPEAAAALMMYIKKETLE